MSLFKVREFWLYHFNNEESFCKASMCAFKQNPKEESSDDCVIVGSEQGLLRVFSPQFHTDEESNLTGFEATDLLLEMQLKEPILQVGSGQFTMNPEMVTIAVLHPRKLSIYGFTAIPGKIVLGGQYQFNLLYESKLKSPADSFIHGRLLNAKGREFICVQFQNSNLAFFEQEYISFYSIFKGFHLPQALVFTSVTDSIIRANCQTVESYSYRKLAMASSSETQHDFKSMEAKSKQLVSDWHYYLGDFIIDLAVIDLDEANTRIFVLGEKSLNILNVNGKVCFTKLLQCNPISIVPYHCPTEESESRICHFITSHEQNILVHEDITLIWMATFLFPPIKACRIQIKNMAGIIITLNENATLTCCYLGTSPSTSLIVFRHSRPGELDLMLKESSKIRKEIKKLTINRFKQPQNDNLLLYLNINHKIKWIKPMIEYCGEPWPTTTVEIYLQTKVPIKNIKIRLSACPSVFLSKKCFDFKCVNGIVKVECQVATSDTLTVSTLELVAIAFYIDSQGCPILKKKITRLPLYLFVKSSEPTQHQRVSIRISMNIMGPTVGLLFPEFLENLEESSALGFEYLCSGQIASIFSSKNRTKLRLESNTISSLWIILEEVLLRLVPYHVLGLKCTFSGDIPLPEYFDLVDEHSMYMQENSELEEILERRAKQFRAVQKLLLIKVRNKVPSNELHISQLIDLGFRQLMTVSSCLQSNVKFQYLYSIALNASTNFLNFMIQNVLQLEYNDCQILQSILANSAHVNTEETWEEQTERNLQFTLFTSFSQPKLTNSQNKPTNQRDTRQLKKLINVLMDHLNKGESLTQLISQKEAKPTHEADPNNPPTKAGKVFKGKRLETIAEIMISE